ncbi:MAG TPA: tetratricopeptide repeat protein [Opitutaceae bacterium]|nr:tetratricopeptide repeat protein [Opitutaceae bacterium]
MASLTESHTDTAAGPLPHAGAGDSRRAIWTSILLLVIAVGLTYADSLSGPFLYDDKGSIEFNPAIRHLFPRRDILSLPDGAATVSGRPVLNLSFALNYAIGGLDVRGYHLANILIHLAAALALFGLIRRTLRLPAMPERYRRIALPAAWGAAAIWALHPLQTEAVTYIVQRAESLMSLFYVLTLYCFVRSVGASRPRGWMCASWLACLAGMATKENMASVPVMLLFYDRAFVAGSFAEAWRRRSRFYLALASTWLLLGGLLLSTGGDRGGSVGFDVGVSWAGYLLTQFPALVRYAILSFWPHPLVFEYGPVPLPIPTILAAEIVIVVSFLAGTAYALWKHPKVGWLGVVMLAILAPTSLVPGTTQYIVEHRMYLPLASVFALLVPAMAAVNRRATILASAAAAAALGLTTAARNRVYRDEVTLWGDVVSKSPENVIARSSYGAALANANRRTEAIVEDRVALRLDPDYPPNLSNLGIALTEMGRPNDGLPYLKRAITLHSREAQAQLNYGVTLDLLGRPAEALPHYAIAIRVNPLMPEAQNDYGDSLCRAGRLAEGLPHLQEAIRMSPRYRDAYFNYAAALVRLGRMQEAQAQWKIGIDLRPDDATAYVSWANFLARQGHRSDAYPAYEAALRLAPDSASAHYSFATTLAADGRYDEAVRQFELALQLQPDYAEAENNLANTLIAMNRVADAIPHYKAALRLRPENAAAHNNLGLALARSGDLPGAAAEFEAAVRIAPDFQNARDNLQHARQQLEGGP